jgi:hypothetical protein
VFRGLRYLAQIWQSAKSKRPLTSTLFRAIPNSELAVVPGTSHFLTMEKPDLVNRLVLDFLEKDPVPTYMPRRRAPASANHEQ